MKKKLNLALVLFGFLAFSGHFLLFLASAYVWITNGLELRGFITIGLICVFPALSLTYNLFASKKLTKKHIFISSLLSSATATSNIAFIYMQANFFFPWIYSYFFMQVVVAGLICVKLLNRGRFMS